MKRFASVKSSDEDESDEDRPSPSGTDSQVSETFVMHQQPGTCVLHSNHHQYHQYHPQVSRWDNVANFNLHWTVRATAYIALMFKAGSIAMAVMSVLALSYLGIMISWGLAFGLPWILAYFYFIWLCPAHQLSMGIRKLKPHRMFWFVVTCLIHIVLISSILVFSSSIQSNKQSVSVFYLGNEDNPNIFVALTISVILLIFVETVVFYAISVIQKERRRRESIEENNIRNNYSSPPPAYQDICGNVNTDKTDDAELLPPKYEDIVFTEEEMIQSQQEEILFTEEEMMQEQQDESLHDTLEAHQEEFLFEEEIYAQHDESSENTLQALNESLEDEETQTINPIQAQRCEMNNVTSLDSKDNEIFNPNNEIVSATNPVDNSTSDIQ